MVRSTHLYNMILSCSILVEAIGYRDTFLVTASIKMAGWLALLLLLVVQRLMGLHHIADWKERQREPSLS